MTQTPYPAGGALIDWHNGEWQVPDNPWIGCIAGDGIGPEIMQASRRVWDAAIKAAYGERRRIVWCDLPLGEAAAGGNVDEILARAAACGYDLSPLLAQLRALA